ncbi:MAG TPA: NAD-dependent epimerase/dehydratase family protein [Pseudonocardia sp.]
MKILVTGAGSMLGSAVAESLAARGDDVTVLQRRPSGLPHREVLADIADQSAVRAAVTGHDAVVHLAAKVDIQGRYREFARVNVDGTRNVVAACRDTGVTRLVHVSTPAVAHSGTSLVGAAAGPAEPRSARGHYARSKAAAELVALAADAAPDGPSTVVLRPHLVWGPGDTQLVGRIITRARAGRLPVVGSGAALIDTTYVSNAADALIAALDRCEEAHGQALVVSNGEPRPVAELLSAICRAAGVRPPRRAVPAPLARTAGAVVEAIWTTSAGRRLGEPPMTRFLAEQLSTAHWFDQRRTRQVLGWSPRVSLDEGLAVLARHRA